MKNATYVVFMINLSILECHYVHQLNENAQKKASLNQQPNDASLISALFYSLFCGTNLEFKQEQKTKKFIATNTDSFFSEIRLERFHGELFSLSIILKPEFQRAVIKSDFKKLGFKINKSSLDIPFNKNIELAFVLHELLNFSTTSNPEHKIILRNHAEKAHRMCYFNESP